MDTPEPTILHTHRFYRINGRILFCVRYTWYANKPGEETIDFEGFPPGDYAAYVTHRYLGGHKEPYRTIADIEGISFPELVQVRCSPNALEEVSKEETFREWQEKDSHV